MTMMRLSYTALARAIVYGACMAAAAALCHVGVPSSTGLAWAVYAMIVFLGPLAVFIDIKVPLNATKRMHDAETVVRMGMLVWLYAMVLPALGSTRPVGGLVQLLELLMYLVNLGISFAIFGPVASQDKKGLFPLTPSRMAEILLVYSCLCLSTCLVLGFGALILGSLFHLRPWVFWGFASVAVAMTWVWRRSMWHNPSQPMSGAQHHDLWPRMAQQETPGQFWHNVGQYYQEHLASIPVAVLCTLGFPTLLSYFDNKPLFVVYPDDGPPLLESDVKNAITLRDPRAAFIWELYPTEEAVQHIKNVDSLAARVQLDTLALPP